MKKLTVLVLLTVTSAFGQQTMKVKPVDRGELFEITPPNHEKLTIFVHYHASESNMGFASYSLFGLEGNEGEKIDLTRFYFQNGKLLFKVGNFKVVSKPVLNSQKEYYLQSFQPIDQ